MAEPQDILQLLDEMQFGPSPENTNNAPQSLIRKPPGSDPRIQAIQRYMQMQGADRIPSFGTPRDIGPGGKSRPLSAKSGREMKSDMAEEAYINYDPRSGNDYFKGDDLAQQRISEMDKPEYMNIFGQSSPNKNDPSIQSHMNNRISSGSVKTAPYQEPLQMRDFWSEDGVKIDPDAPARQGSDMNRSGRMFTDEELIQDLLDKRLHQDI